MDVEAEIERARRKGAVLHGRNGNQRCPSGGGRGRVAMMNQPIDARAKRPSNHDANFISRQLPRVPTGAKVSLLM